MRQAIKTTESFRAVSGLATIFVALMVVADSSSVAIAQGQFEAPVWGGIIWGTDPVRSIAQAFHRQSKSKAPVDVQRWTDSKNIQRFIERQSGCEVLYHRSLPLPDGVAALGARWPKGTNQPTTFLLGQVRIAVAVNKGNPVKHVTLAQIRDMLAMENAGKDWKEVGGNAGAIKPYGETDYATSRWLIHTICMPIAPPEPKMFHRYRDEFERCANAEAVLEKLRTDRDGIGYFLYSGQELPPHVRLLAVAQTAHSEPVALELGAVVQKDYPLAELLVLYLRPDASAQSSELCEFAMSPAGAAIAKSYGITTTLQDAEAKSDERLASARGGRGETIRAAGPKALRALVPELATEYVRAREVIQLTYAASDSDVAPINAFVSDRANRPDLLFLSGPPSVKALELHGARWKEMDATGQVVAGRATVVMVNAANKIDALSLEEIEAVFSGETEDWTSIKGTGLVPPERRPPGTKPTVTISIHRYGLRKGDPAAELFQQARPSRAKQGRVAQLADTKEVVAAVGADPYAIGCVDLAAMPDSGQAVKALGLMIPGDGIERRIIHPTAAAIKDGTYPFAERLALYVHPEASKEAKSLGEFLLTPVALGSSTSADQAAALERPLRAHGFLPLTQAKARTEPKPPSPFENAPIPFP